jgi:hypothetical protein
MVPNTITMTTPPIFDTRITTSDHDEKKLYMRMQEML